MSDKRVVIRIVFDDPHEIAYEFPLNIMNRRISHVLVDNVRYEQRIVRPRDDCEWMNLD